MSDTRKGPETDAELVRRAREGDRDAMDLLVDLHHGAVYRLALAILGDGDRAADATQETFIKAVRSLKGFRREAAFRTWLLAIARNQARGMIRAEGRRRTTSLDDAGAIATEQGDPVEGIARSRAARRVRETLERLPEKQRMAVRLRIDEGLSFREVGELIGSSEGAARVNYHHGVRRLRELLTEDEEGGGE